MSNQANSIPRRYLILDLETGERFQFHAMVEFESGWNWSKSANWVSTGIIGRSSPIQGYQDSNPASITLNVPIFSSIEAGDGRTVQDVDREAKFFASMPYPDYSGGTIKPPHRYMLILASQLHNWEVVCQSVDVSVLGPWDLATGLSHRVQVSVSFIEVDLFTPKDYRQVRG